MIKKAVTSLLLVFTLIASLAPAVHADSADEHQIFDLVNNERSKKRLGRLDWNDRLADMARSYSKQMSKENFFSHYDPNGKTVVDRAKNVRVSWQKIGENLFYCSGLTEFNDFAVKGWMKSFSHRQNILDPEWTASGIGVYEGRDGRVFVTQIFIEEKVLTQRPRRAQGKESVRRNYCWFDKEIRNRKSTSFPALSASSAFKPPGRTNVSHISL